MYTQLVVLQGDIKELKVDAIVQRDSISVDAALRDAEGARLGAAYRHALHEAAASNAKSIAFPDTEVFPDPSDGSYSRARAAEIALTEVKQFLEKNPGCFTEIIFACWDTENYHVYKEMLGGENRAINIP